MKCISFSVCNLTFTKQYLLLYMQYILYLFLHNNYFVLINFMFTDSCNVQPQNIFNQGKYLDLFSSRLQKLSLFLIFPYVSFIFK